MNLRLALKALSILVALGGGGVYLATTPFDVSVRSNDPELSKNQEHLSYKGQPFSGILKEFYPDGALYTKTRYRNGLKSGPSEKYDFAGRLIAQGTYLQGQREGLLQGWFSEGPKKFEYHFKHGILEGTQTDWHINGAIYRQEVYHGGLMTDRKILFSGGEIFSNYAKREGRIYGVDGGALCMETKKEGAK